MLEQLLIINSSQRINGTSSNFTYNTGAYCPSSVYSFRINKVSIPYSWYPIINQQFRIVFNAVNYDVTINDGYYNPTQLVTELQTRINTSLGAGNLTVSYLAQYGVFQIESVNPADSFTLNFGINNLPANQQYKSIGIAMGFATVENVSQILYNNVNFAASLYAINLTGQPNIYIKSGALQLYTSSFFNRNASSVIQSIPVEANPQGYIIWQNTYPVDFKQDPVKSNSLIDLQLVDEFDNEIDLRGLDWTIEIQYFYKF